MAHRPSIAEINAMKKDDLKKTLIDLLEGLSTGNNGEDGADDTRAMLRTILDEVKKSNVERDKINEEIKSLKKTNETLCETLAQQQRYLESVDAERRACNLIITGVDEGSDLGHTDEEKVNLILRTVGHENVTTTYIGRLGAAAANRTRRPIKVVVGSARERNGILKDASKLKNAGDTFSRIYIKKDLHPGVRREIIRIKEAEKREREKPENAGRDVRYDRESRTLTIDGQVVDRFSPAFF